MRSEAQKAVRRKYEQSEKGKTAKKLHEATYIASGGRVLSEKRRAEKPLSEARKQARLQYQLMRRSGEKKLNLFDAFALKEAVSLVKLRAKVCGGSWHVDHIIPVSRGGLSTHDNIQVVPAIWNRVKANKNTDKFFGS